MYMFEVAHRDQCLTDVPGFSTALETFRHTALQVPAYADFLAERGVDADAIRTPRDFAMVPAVTKANYLHVYPLHMLLRNGDVAEAGTWSTSSGSSGRPTYWPRDARALEQSVELHSRIFRRSFNTEQRSTLVVVGFAMGNWIGGTYTYAAVTRLRQRGHRVSVIAPGIDVPTIVANISELGPLYDQIVLAGYPPFVKDVLDQATDDVLRQDIRILLAGESITEEWRDYVLDRIGKTGREEETCLIYGTADAGMIGHESPDTIAIRRLARTDREFSTALFGEDCAQPTFVEYDPWLRYAETDEQGCLLYTVDNAIPLVRYRINDQGSVLSAKDLRDRAREHGHNLLLSTASRDGGFIALRRRTDIAATFYALKIFPDSVRAALEDSRVTDSVTGKFRLVTDSDSRHEQSLLLDVELRAGLQIDDGLSELLHKLVVDSLRRTNTEFRELHRTLGSRAEPAIRLHRYGVDGFRHDIKHQWTGAPT